MLRPISGSPCAPSIIWSRRANFARAPSVGDGWWRVLSWMPMRDPITRCPLSHPQPGCAARPQTTLPQSTMVAPKTEGPRTMPKPSPFPPLPQYQSVSRDTQGATSGTSGPVPNSADPGTLYPHLSVLVGHRRSQLKECYTRHEVRVLLGISDKTLGRWLACGELEAYGLPDAFTSAADIERCLEARRNRIRKRHVLPNASSHDDAPPL